MKILAKSVLFKHFSEEQIQHVLTFLDTKEETYTKGEVLFFEGDVCEHLGIVTEGSVELQTIFPTGKVITHLEMKAPSVFGEALIYGSHNNYPVTVIASSKCRVLLVDREKLIHGLTHHPILLSNFLELLSQKLFMMNDKIKLLSLDTIRKKLSMFFLGEYKRQKSTMLTISLTQKELAEHLAIQRPSLSRELLKMKEEGVIDYYKDSIKLLSIDALESSLL